MISALAIKVGYQHVFVKGWYCYSFIQIIDKVMYGEKTGTCVRQIDGSVK